MFLDALASLVLMIVTHWLINRFEINSPSDPSDVITQNEMSFEMEYNAKWNVPQNGMSLKRECHSKCNFTQNGMSLKMESHSK